MVNSHQSRVLRRSAKAQKRGEYRLLSTSISTFKEGFERLQELSRVGESPRVFLASSLHIVMADASRAYLSDWLSIGPLDAHLMKKVRSMRLQKAAHLQRCWFEE